jgi:C4-dicarboxylate transporter DctM subunit
MNMWRPGPATAIARRAEDGLSLAVFAAMVLLALTEVAARTIGGRSLPGSIVLVQHLTLWVTLLGAALAARSNQLLALSTPYFLPVPLRGPIRIVTSALGSAVAASLCLASADLVRIERDTGGLVAWGIPAWVAMTILPAGLAVISGRIIWHASETIRGRILAACGLIVPGMFWVFQASPDTRVLMPCVVMIIAATACGMPIFAAMGGAALLFFWGDGTPANAVPAEAYRLTTSPMLPAIPLFALGGYLLAEGGASRRLTRLFTALFSWMPGGLAIVTTLVLAFFTPLTGASGITILSMGGVLLPVLVGARYAESTSIGLVTVSGSIGLLFFPSLPVFMYAFYANVPFERLFIGGLLPGILLVLVVAGWAAVQGWRHGAVRAQFESREAVSALWEAKWDLVLPAAVLGGVVAGIVTLVEAAAFTVLYALTFECFVHRTLHLTRDVPRVVVECATLIGGFMIILGVALGFTNYLVIAEIPSRALEWSQARIESPLVFLLALNVFLIVVGALMDIYSAIVIVVPLVLPMATAFGVNPVHLAVIFLANMELGYLMPPMGENLFLSSYRFKQPLIRIYQSTLPYTVILLAAVLLITYVPWLSLGLLEALERHGYLAR